nr:extracellular solute-binding protein [Angustibacter aerolatus]
MPAPPRSSTTSGSLASNHEEHHARPRRTHRPDPPRLPGPRRRHGRRRGADRLRRRQVGQRRRRRAGAAKPSGTFTAKYDGPKITLSYWNGFTGGDGPFMKQMVAQFQKEHPTIAVNSNTIEWAQYYQRLPAAVTAGKGPDVGAMHLDQAGDERRPQDHRAGRRRRVRDRAERGRLHAGGLAGRAVQGRPLRHPARRALARDVLQHRRLHEGRRHRGTDGQGLLPGRARRAEGQGRPGPAVLDADPLACAPDVPVPAVAERRRAVRHRRQQGDVRLRAGRRGAHLDARHGDPGLQPVERGDRLAVRRVQEQEGVGHLGRHLADQRPERRQACRTPWPRCRRSARRTRSGPTRTTST